MTATATRPYGSKGAATAAIRAPFYGMVPTQMALEGLLDMSTACRDRAQGASGRFVVCKLFGRCMPHQGGA